MLGGLESAYFSPPRSSFRHHFQSSTRRTGVTNTLRLKWYMKLIQGSQRTSNWETERSQIPSPGVFLSDQGRLMQVSKRATSPRSLALLCPATRAISPEECHLTGIATATSLRLPFLGGLCYPTRPERAISPGPWEQCPQTGRQGHLIETISHERSVPPY